MPKPKLRLIGLAFVLSLIVGCVGVKSLGLGRWPLQPRRDLPAFSDIERSTLIAAVNGAKSPQLAAKVYEFLTASEYNAAVLKAYNREALQINLKQLAALGYSKEECVAFEAAWRNQYRIEG